MTGGGRGARERKKRERGGRGEKSRFENLGERKRKGRAGEGRGKGGRVLEAEIH